MTKIEIKEGQVAPKQKKATSLDWFATFVVLGGLAAFVYVIGNVVLHIFGLPTHSFIYCFIFGFGIIGAIMFIIILIDELGKNGGLHV